MHRHGYKGRKFGRERDQRSALIKSLAESLVKYESIETTLPKAKEVVPYVEKLITKAKKGDLHNRRMVISDLQTIATAHKLVDVIAPKLGGRVSGHLRIERTTLRRGDNAQLARISFVDDLKAAPVAKKAVPVEKPKTVVVKKSATKPAAKRTLAKKKVA
ncbi:50S ribosomal protein L17 [Candidatus Saccharibacteria bacterium]|nr:50S ribosomal protein L17 [Candidatus Saccharibacteria bacterium]